MARRSRIALVAPYWSFWEGSASGRDLRQQRTDLLARIRDDLEARDVEVGCTELLDDPDTPAAVLEAAQDADLTLVVVTMATPPSHTIPVLAASGPLLVWALNLGMGSHGDMDRIVQDGATVGTPQLTNLLVREGRPFSLVSGPLDAPTLDRCQLAIRAELLAEELRGARIARIGNPMPGYLSVDADDHDLEASLGVDIVHLDADDVRDRANGLSARDVRARERSIAEHLEIPADLDRDGFSATLRLDAAMEFLVSEHGLAAGTINCHVEALRYGTQIGVTPCFALGESTSRGVPWTCTGDVITAIAMLVGRRLAGAALYHEIESIDPDTGVAVLANTGEHDRAWCPAGVRGEIRENPWFRNDPRTGSIAWFPLAPGPATLVAFTPTRLEPSGFRFVTASGRILDEGLDDCPTVGGAFRFAADEPHRAWEAWVAAGVNHHSAVVPGLITDAVATVAARMRLGHVVVC